MRVREFRPLSGLSMCPSAAREKRATSSRNALVIVAILVLVATSLRFDLFLTDSFNALYQQIGGIHQVNTKNNADASAKNKTAAVLDATLGYRDDVNETIATCLMVMDDNHRLVEWLAYHYYAMPLRHLVILVDPLSVSSPNEILDRWRPYMTIEEWKQEDFADTTTRMMINVSMNNRSNAKLGIRAHRRRQSNFVGKCAQHYKKMNHTWVTFHDVDEYWVLNEKYVGLSKTHELMQQPGFILRMLKTVRASMKNGTLPVNEHYNGTCVATYRQAYSAFESTKKERRKDVPNFLDPMRFDTLRFRYPKRRPIVGKSLVAVSEYTTIKNLHWFHDFDKNCPHLWGKRNHYLRINHYVGSWKSFNSRPNDRRKGEGEEALKSKKDWAKDSARDVGVGADDGIRPWIGAFVRMMGEERSKVLLQGAGVLVDYDAILANNTAS